MRTLQRSKEEIIKEKLGGAVQVLPNEGLSALEVCDNISSSFNFEFHFVRERKKRKRPYDLFPWRSCSDQRCNTAETVELYVAVTVEPFVFFCETVIVKPLKVYETAKIT